MVHDGDRDGQAIVGDRSFALLAETLTGQNAAATMEQNPPPSHQAYAGKIYFGKSHQIYVRTSLTLPPWIGRDPPQ